MGEPVDYAKSNVINCSPKRESFTLKCPQKKLFDNDDIVAKADKVNAVIRQKNA